MISGSFQLGQLKKADVIDLLDMMMLAQNVRTFSEKFKIF